jgi:hypothetical protein
MGPVASPTDGSDAGRGRGVVAADAVGFQQIPQPGGEPLAALVPPWQPTSSIGTRAASQPVKNRKSGRIGLTAAIRRIMCETSPVESLIPITRGNSSANRRTAAGVALPRGPPTDWGELGQVHFRLRHLPGVARRTARDDIHSLWRDPMARCGRPSRKVV